MQYTEEQWGQRQQEEYGADLMGAMRNLTVYPYEGKSRDDLRPGLRSMAVRNHLILYRVRPGVIRVLRIVHQSRNITSDFEFE